VIALGALAQSAPAGAAEEAEFTISIKDHKFDPAEIKVPASKAIKLTVNNLDASPEEFESHPLGVEKVIAGKASAIIRLKPLEKGTYKFVGEYNEETAKGAIIAE
jgi:plastocyanin